MKKFFTILFLSFCVALVMNGQSVSINTDGSTADASSVLDVKSTTKGMLAPRMTTAQRTTILTPANGLLVYDTDTKSFWYYNGTAWTNITGAGGGGGGFSLPYDASVNLPGTAFKVTNSGNAIEGSSTGGSGVYGYSENGSGFIANSHAGFGILASSSLATAIRANSFNQNPTIHSTNSNETGTAMRGEATGTSGVGVYGVASSSTGFGIRGVNTTGAGIFGFSTSGQGVVASSINGVGLRAFSTNNTALEVNGNVKIAGGNTSPGVGKVLTSDANGNATWKGAVAFKVKSNSYSEMPEEMNLRALFSNEVYDLGNDYDIPSGSFTAPEKGLYHFDASIGWRHAVYTHATARIMLDRNGAVSEIAYLNHHFDWVFTWEHYDFPVNNSLSTDVVLLPGDKVYVSIYQSNPDSGDDAKRTLVTSNFSFNGHLVTRL